MKTETVKHTPTPWEIKITQEGFEIVGSANKANYKSVIAWIKLGGATWKDTWNKEQEANAEFIVRACNSHEELLEACKEALPLCNEIIRDDPYANMAKKIATKLENVIAKAKGKV